MNELQMQNIGGIDYHLKDQYARDIIATSENGLDSQSNLPVASRPYIIGEYLIDQNRLYYEVIDTISTGDVLVVGSNIKRTTVSAEINKLKGNSAIMAIEIVAPIEDTLLSAREYQADDPLYWANEHLSGLYEATMHIVVGDALIIGTNIKPAKKIAKSVKDINDEITDMTGILGAKNLCPNNASTVTQSGVTYTVNADGSVKITGTATADNGITLGVAVIPKGKYKLTTGQSQESGAPQFIYVQRMSDNVVIGRSSDNIGGALGEFALNADTEVGFTMKCENGRTGVVTLYPMCRPATIEDESYVLHVPTNRELDLQDKKLSSQISNLANYSTGSVADAGWGLIQPHLVLKKCGKVVDFNLMIYRPKGQDMIPNQYAFGALTDGFQPASTHYVLGALYKTGDPNAKKLCVVEIRTDRSLHVGYGVTTEGYDGLVFACSYLIN